MKTLSTTIFAFLFCWQLLGQGCLPDGITFNYQSQVDSFAILYPDCKVIEGNLTIVPLAPTPVTNLDGLLQIDSIKGTFECGFCTEELLESFENLSYVGKDFKLYRYRDTLVGGPINLTHIGRNFNSEDGNSIRNFGGLSNLKTIEGDFYIHNSQVLSGFYGFDNLSYIGGSFQTAQCFDLHSYAGLERLDSIGGRLWIESDELINFKGFDNLQKIGGFLNIRDQENLTNLDGLENLRIIGGGLSLAVNRELVNIDALKNLEKVEEIAIVNCNKLEAVDFSNVTNLRDFSISSCDGITNLDDFPNMVDSAELEIRNCDNFNGKIPGNIGLAKSISISSNENLQSLEGLEQLFEVHTNISIGSSSLIDNLQPLRNLKSVGSELVIGFFENLQNLNGLENLETYGTLKIWNNENLESIETIRDAKVEKKSNFNFESTVEITNNPKLAICDYQYICNHIGSPSALRKIENNATGCATEQEVLDECAGNFTEVYYQVYFDINENGTKDSLEPFLPHIPIKLEPIGFSTFSGRDRPGVSFLENIDYELSIEISHPWTNSTPTLIPFTAGQTDIISFGIYPTENISELVPSIYISNTRCNEEATLEVNLNNFGTTIADGNLLIEIDSLIDSLEFIDFPDINLSDFFIGWNFEDFVPGEVLTKKIKFTMPGPPEISPGEILELSTLSIYNDVLGEHRTPDFEFDREIACAYDPNDKLVSPNRAIQVFEPPRELNLTLFDEALTYTVRFQNTGNAPAYDVVIRDTLDENLDIETFRFLNSSHYEVLNITIEDDRFLTFDFKNIFLPDSTADFDGSQGYVSYQISTKENLLEETPIRNTASIYFDQNPPIVTNTTENIMVSAFPTSSAQSIDNQLDVSIFPNPTTGKIYLSGDNLHQAKITISDLTGRILLVKKLDFNSEIDLPLEVQGMLLIKIETEEGVAVKRILKN